MQSSRICKRNLCWTFYLIILSRKDTRRSLSSADHVDAGGDDVGGFAATGQVFDECHLVEVQSCVHMVLVHL